MLATALLVVASAVLAWLIAPEHSSVSASPRKPVPAGSQRAVFAAGCFWHVQQAFSEVKGVIYTRAGYTGGLLPNPSYKDVCAGGTGHAEAVEVVYDPRVVSYNDLLNVFWKIHDPTTLNRQGPDIGEQYRSSIFYTTGAQRAAAELSVEKLEKSRRFRDPIVTEIVQAGKFYPAEEYHQMYLQKHGRAACPVTPGRAGR